MIMTLIMARKHCCCDSCRHSTWQITFGGRLEMLGILPEARAIGTPALGTVTD